ncbi:hypothetical protein HN51_062200 [Arachis hypogaea]|nr:Alpha-mannosidase [Arachis hypogaea]
MRFIKSLALGFTRLLGFTKTKTMLVLNTLFMKVGPILTDNGVEKEAITQKTANMTTNKDFYTDSNGRDFLKRVYDHKKDWPFQVTQPVAGNYYPIKFLHSLRLLIVFELL